MEIKQQQQGAVMVLRPDGPVAGDDADQFLLDVHGVLSDSRGRIVLDATDIAFVDSRGLEALLEVSEEMARGGRTPKLSCVNETVRLVLELTELSPKFEYFDDVNVAVRSFL